MCWFCGRRRRDEHEGGWQDYVLSDGSARLTCPRCLDRVERFALSIRNKRLAKRKQQKGLRRRQKPERLLGV